MLAIKKISFLIYLFTLSYFLFNEIPCTSGDFFGVNCKWIGILGKGVLIGGIYIFVDRKFLFNFSKE
jgi:hypothetical protein